MKLLTTPAQRRARAPYLSLALALPFVLTACGSRRGTASAPTTAATTAPRTPSDPVAAAAAAASARLRAVPLPTVRSPRWRAPTPSPRVVLGPSDVEVDVASALVAWPADRRDAALRAASAADGGAPPLVRTGVATLRQGLFAPEDVRGGEAGFVVMPLTAALRDVAAIAAADGDRGSVLNVYASAEVPFRTVFVTLYTAGNRGYARYGLVARRGNEDVAVEVHPATVDTLVSGGLSTGGLAPQLFPIESPAAASPRPSPLVVVVRPDGYGVLVDLAPLAASCREPGIDRLTIARSPGSDADAALAQCLTTVRTDSRWRDQLARAQAVRVAAASTTPYAAVVRAIDIAHDVLAGGGADPVVELALSQ